MEIQQQRHALLDWYHTTARELPWRSCPEPWRVMVSEFMLQQTQVKTVLPRYEPFLDLFPSPKAMVEAGQDAVISAWAGLGYYRRARALFAAASAVVERHHGRVPGEVDSLRALPGVGAYTSAAIASIGFGVPAAVVDGNVERVIARLRAIHEPVRKASGRRTIQALADEFLNPSDPGDHNQAMMDLGARICRPKRADCLICPLQEACSGKHDWSALPVLPERKKTVPKKVERRLFLVDAHGHTAWRRRPENGLYSNLPDLLELAVGESSAPYGVVARRETTTQRLSHRELEIEALRIEVDRLPSGYRTGPVGAFLAEGPPTPVARLVRRLAGDLE